jgi:TRAP-type C4-dicarboxylate transport system substrate-binding protein
MRTTRRTFVKGTLATTAASTLPAPALLAQSVEELKLATFVPPSHIIMQSVLTPWAQEVAKLSGGKMTVRMFPSMQLGGKPPELYRQTVQGISDICFTLPGYTSSDFPMMALTELPGAAKSGEDGTRKLWANMDKFLGPQFKGTKVLMLWNSDSAALMSRSKPIRTLADVKGLKIRTPSAAQSAQLVALGATPIDMPANQIYNNLERGVIDAAMIPMSAAIDFKLIEVARHFTVDAPIGRSNFLVAMNEGRYQKLPAELKKIIDDTTGLNLSLKGAQTYDVQNERGLTEARKGREVIVLPGDEAKRWQVAFSDLIKKTAADADKAGLQGTGLVKALGLL